MMEVISRFGVLAALAAALAAQPVAAGAPYQIYGLNFSPYKHGQSPDWGSQISPEQLAERMSIIQPYVRWIRSYGSTDGLQYSGQIAHGLGLKAALGAWISSSLAANETQLANLIGAARRGEADLLIVGSEVLRRNDDGSEAWAGAEAKLIEYIARVKQAVPGLPVTYADTYWELLNHPNLLAVCDLLLANYYPYWEGTAIDGALARLDAAHRQLQAAAPGKRILISETGWPSAGNTVGAALPSPQNASRYFLDFTLWAERNKVDYFYFEAFDEAWKYKPDDPNSRPQEAHFGVWDENGQMKPGMGAVLAGRDCLLNWAEQNYPQLFAPAGQATAVWPPYTYRYYPGTHAYLGVSADDSQVYYLAPDGNMLNAGAFSGWLGAAGCLGL